MTSLSECSDNIGGTILKPSSLSSSPPCSSVPSINAFDSPALPDIYPTCRPV